MFIRFLFYVFQVFRAEKDHEVEGKGSGETTAAAVRTLLEAFLKKPVRFFCFIDAPE
jgi:hypothetical protein